MATDPKIRPDHLRRQAVVYVRQSTVQQVRANRESTVRQYALADRAKALGCLLRRTSPLTRRIITNPASISARRLPDSIVSLVSIKSRIPRRSALAR